MDSFPFPEPTKASLPGCYVLKGQFHGGRVDDRASRGVQFWNPAAAMSRLWDQGRRLIKGLARLDHSAD